MAEYVGARLAYQNIACFFNFLRSIDAIMTFDGLTKDGSEILMGTLCGDFGAMFCPEDYEVVKKFCNESDLERFAKGRQLRGSDGQFFRRLVDFPQLGNEFYKYLESRGIQHCIEGNFVLVDQLYRFAL